MTSEFKSNIKSKIIIIILVSILALIGSYWVNKYTFNSIHKSVSDLSYTNRKLVLVNNLLSGINESERAYRQMLLYGTTADTFIQKSTQLRLYTDSLWYLCEDNAFQRPLLDSMYALLDKRQQLIINYVAFRRQLRNNNRVLQQASLLDSLISTGPINQDSLVLSENRNRVVTWMDSSEVVAANQKQNLLQRLFGKKKEKPVVRQIVQEEISTKVDTLVQVRKSEVIEEAQRIINSIGSEQTLRRQKLLEKETALTNFENTFHTQASHLLEAIEQDIITQIQQTRQQAEDGIQASRQRVFIIIAVFILLALLILVFLLMDVARSNRYRQLLEQAKDEAEWQNQSRQRFLSNMSHEIRTPLQSVIGYTELLNQQDQTKNTYIKAIKNASEHLLDVINEILDYNKIHSGHFTFEQVPFSLNQLLEDIHGMIAMMASNKQLTLQWDVKAAEQTYVLGDPFRLKQILLNLLGNAVKFTEEGYIGLEVQVQFVNDHCKCIFKVFDTGIGIPYDMQERIFEQFEQANVPMEYRYKGTGLGLGIVKALVEGQGGVVSLESTPSVGSAFKVVLTYPQTSMNAVEQETSLAEERNHVQGEIWLVDDDPLILQLCSLILTKHGYVYRSFSSAESVLKLLKYGIAAPALVLLDIRMPGLNGFQMLDALKQYFHEHTAVVALTAQALPEEVEALTMHGFDHVLLKPFKERDLLALLNTQVTSSESSLASPDEDESIWQMFENETRTDISLLKKALEDEMLDQASLIVHRLAGRLAQMGAMEIGRQLRQIERNIYQTHHLPKEEVFLAIDAIEDWMRSANSKSFL